MRETRINHDAHGLTFCVVAARFNQALVEAMVTAALETLASRGASDADIELRWVPGAFELPLAARWAAQSNRFGAVLAFGVVIRGETEHYRLIVESTAHAFQRVALESGVPVLDGVLAVLNAEQAEARAGGTHGNRGADVALAAIAMANLKRECARDAASPPAGVSR